MGQPLHSEGGEVGALIEKNKYSEREKGGKGDEKNND